MSLPNSSQKLRLAKAARAYLDQLGVAPDGASSEGLVYLEGRGFTPQQCQTWGLGYVAVPEPGHEQYLGRVSIPYITPTGVVQIKFRCIEDHSCKEAHGGTKYLGLTGNGLWMYNTRAFVLDSPEIVVTEGEFDAMAVHTRTNVPSVGFPGTQSVDPVWYRAFTGYQRVLILADGDKPGREAAKAITKHLSNADVIRLPDGEDASSLLLKPGGLEQFYEMCGLEAGDSE